MKCISLKSIFVLFCAVFTLLEVNGIIRIGDKPCDCPENSYHTQGVLKTINIRDSVKTECTGCITMYDDCKKLGDSCHCPYKNQTSKFGNKCKFDKKNNWISCGCTRK